MNPKRRNDFGFAPAHDAPIPYLQRIRTYYQGLGYEPPYDGRITPKSHSLLSQHRSREPASR